MNKLPLADGTMRVFSKVDEGMIEMVGRMVGLFFKSSVGADKNARFAHSLTSVIKLGVYLNSLQNFSEIFNSVETEFKDILCSPAIRLYVLKLSEGQQDGELEPKKLLFRYTSDREYVEHSQESGLISLAISTKEPVKIKNCQNHPLFNSKYQDRI